MNIWEERRREKSFSTICVYVNFNTFLNFITTQRKMMRIHIDIEQWKSFRNNKNNNNSNVLIDDNIPMHNWILFCYFASIFIQQQQLMKWEFRE